MSAFIKLVRRKLSAELFKAVAEAVVIISGITASGTGVVDVEIVSRIAVFFKELS